MLVDDLPLRAAYFCLRSQIQLVSLLVWESVQRAKGGLDGAAVGKSVDFKQTKISQALLVLLGLQKYSKKRKKIKVPTKLR